MKKNRTYGLIDKIGLLKMITIMRFTIFILFLSLSQTFAVNSYSQQAKLSLDMRDVRLEDVLDRIEKNSEYFFMYNKNMIDVDRKVDIQVEEKNVNEVLNKIFANTDISYSIKDRQILLINNRMSDTGNESSTQQQKSVSGKVTDSSGASLPGVSVVVKGTTTGVITDMDGFFSLPKVPENATLQFSFVGMKTQEITVGTKTSINVTLDDETIGIEEVVAVGYGTTSKKQLTTSTSNMKMDNVDQGAGNNAVKMLQGRASGINIVSPSGTPGAPPVVLVRGIGSISGGSQPLYVVDGVPSETFPNLNPNDIESMDVLKDASAAAIYGSRANSGVVIITTKSGKEGKAKVSFSAKSGIGSIYHDIKMANAGEYANAMQAAIDNYNKQKGTSLSFYKPGTIEETDWVGAISRPYALNSTVDVSVTGGTEKTKYFTSFGYYDQEGILKTTRFQQYSFRAKFSQIINQFVKLNVNFSATATPQRLVEENDQALKILRNAREEQPWYSPTLSEGTYKVNGTLILRHNPAMYLTEEKWAKTNMEGLGTVSLEITPVKGLKYTPSISGYGIVYDEKKKLTDQMAARRFSAGWGALSKSRNLTARYIFDNILNYTGEVGKLNYTAMVGHSYESFTSDLFGALSSNYSNNAYPSASLDVINAGPNIYPIPTNNGYEAYNLESYLGRITLDYKSRYMFNASIRRDGSSRFSKDKRFGTFPSASFAWRVSKESFWKFKKVFNDLKLRVSYGSTGSMAGIGNYSPLSLVSVGQAYNNQGGLILSQDAQNVTWEKANQINAGFDAEFFKGRLNVAFDVYSQKTTDLLFNRPVFASTGYTSIPSNIGSLQNQGLEFSAEGKILTGSLKWNASANISFMKNKLLSLYAGKDMYIVPASGLNQLGGQMHALINGKPISAFYMLKMMGIYQNDSEVPTKLFAKGVRAGDVIYQDVNNDQDITDADRQYVGKAIPDFYGGITNNLKWKGFELNVFAQYSVGGKVMASWRGVNSEGAEHLGDAVTNVKLLDGTTVAQFFNLSKKAATEYWTGPGTSNTMPRPVRNGVFSGYTYNYNLLPSTRQLEDGSFFKIKTVTLAYELPQNMIKSFASTVRVYASVDNLLTLTKYSGYDPEQTYAASPGDSNYGVDFGLQPSLRTYLFGVNINF